MVPLKILSPLSPLVKFSSWAAVSQVFSWVVVFGAWLFCLSFYFSAKPSVHLAGAIPAEILKLLIIIFIMISLQF